MDTIYNYASERVSSGARYRIDLKSRTLAIDGKKIIDHGKYEGELGVTEHIEDFSNAHVENLYERYKHSSPSEMSDSRRSGYFRALKASDLDTHDLLYGAPREIAMFELEFCILAAILNGLKWNEPWGKWFWQSSADKDFVILREWIDGE